MKKTLITTAAAAIFGLSSLSAQVSVIYDGDAITVDNSVTSGTWTSDAGVGNPAGSLSGSGLTNGQSITFASSNSSYFLTPNDVDFSGSFVVKFDYLVPNGSANNKLADLRLKLVNPNNNVATTALDALGVNGQGLTADGTWHTLELGAAEGSNFAWAAGIQTLFDSNDIDPSVPQQFYITASAGLEGLDVHIDNVAVAVPEPSTYALLFGVLAVGFVALRRRRRG